jgi:hypothetical protein
MEFSKLVSYLFHSQTQVHIFHLQTTSYAEHKALQKYYESIDGLIDGLVESYQGKYGVITDYTNFGILKYENTQQVIDYFEALCNGISQVHSTIEDSYLQNQLDTITELIKSTMYKLIYLK